MRRTAIFLNLFLCSIFATLPLQSFACKPAINSIESYVQDRTKKAMVFTGTVTSIALAQTFDDGYVYDVKMNPERWFVGEKKQEVVIRSYVSRRSDPDCPSIRGFRAEVGEQWLIFGESFETKVEPDKFNSRKFENGALPEKFRLELEQKGIHL